jgi:hypothetical protein
LDWVAIIFEMGSKMSMVLWAMEIWSAPLEIQGLFGLWLARVAGGIVAKSI